MASLMQAANGLPLGMLAFEMERENLYVRVRDGMKRIQVINQFFLN